MSDFQQITLEYKPTTLDYSPPSKGITGICASKSFFGGDRARHPFCAWNRTVVVNKNGLDVSDK